MIRITQNLFDSIQKITLGESAIDQAAPVEENNVDKAHFCATHVEHALYGKGTCISEEHAEPNEDGSIEWYTVQFDTGAKQIYTEQLNILQAESHMHSKKKAMKEEDELEENDGNLANNAKPYNKVTHGDVIAGRLGKDEYGGKKKVMAKEDTQVDEAFPSVADALKKDKSKFDTKKVSTGTIYTKKYKAEPDDADDMPKVKKAKKMAEGSMQTIINHNDFVIEVTNNPTFKDYFNAIQMIVPASNEDIQREIVTIATEAFNEGYSEIIIESLVKAGFEDILNNYRAEGYNILDENYNSDSEKPYVEYTVEKDGNITQYVHTGAVIK
jgi:hypothetical protein